MNKDNMLRFECLQEQVARYNVLVARLEAEKDTLTLGESREIREEIRKIDEFIEQDLGFF